MNPLIDELRQLLVSALRLTRRPEDIDPDADLFAGELGLDSVDAVQLVTSIENHFAIQLSDRELARPLTSLHAIAELLDSRGVGAPSPPVVDGAPAGGIRQGRADD